MTPRSSTALVFVALITLSSWKATIGQVGFPEKKLDIQVQLDIQVREVGPPPVVEVLKVTPRKLGYRMGLVQGDVILSVNGQKVQSSAQLKKLRQVETATIVWKGNDQVYYRNTVRTFRSITVQEGPANQPLISDLEEAKSENGFKGGPV